MKRKKSERWMIWAIVVMTILIVAFGVLLHLGGGIIVR
jgi:hypothetical protein